MNSESHIISSIYLQELLAAIESKRKGIKHSFSEWSFKLIEDDTGEAIEFTFERISEKPSRFVAWVWNDGSLCLDLRTYAKHEGWEFEHRVEGTLKEENFGEFVSLIKNIGIYFRQSSSEKLKKAVADLGK